MRLKQNICFLLSGWLLLVTGLYLGMASLAYAATAYDEEFNVDANPPAGWTVDASLQMATQGGKASFTINSVGWGSASSPVQNIDVTAYPYIRFVVTDVQAVGGRGVQFAVHEEGQPDDIKLGDYQSAPGTYEYNIPALTGWSGNKSFRVVVWVEANIGTTAATLDSIVITDNVTPTPTPTPNPNIGWAEEFKSDLQPPTGWAQDFVNLVSNSSANNGVGYGYVTLSGRNWGDAISPDITVNTDQFTTLTINVAGLDPDLGFKLAVLHDGVYTFVNSEYTYTPGIYNYDYTNAVRAVTPGWTGQQTFKVLVFIEGPVERTDTATLDYIRITSYAIPTATPTLTPSLTPTVTPTSTPTPDPNIGWAEEFKSDLQPPTGWAQDFVNLVSNSSANNGAGYGYVTLSGRNWGDAISPDITVNTDQFTTLTINVAGLDPDLGFKLAVLHDGTYTFLNSVYTYTPGIYNYNYASAVRAVTPGWTGQQTFKVLVFIEGPVERTDTATLDYIRITSYAIPTPTVIPSATLTRTPTSTLTQTLIPTSTLTSTPTITTTQTLIPTSTVTATPTITTTQTLIPTSTVTATPTITTTQTLISTATLTVTPTITTTQTLLPTSTLTATPTITTTQTPLPTSTLTATPTPTITFAMTFTATATRTATASTTFMPTNTSTPTPTAKQPQKVKAWVDGCWVLRPGQSRLVLAQSMYRQVPQPSIALRYQVVYGTGTFRGVTVTTAVTGSQGEPAQVMFTASRKNWDVNVVEVDNQKLGGKCYVVLLVSAWYQENDLKGASAGNSEEYGDAPVFENEADALGKAEELGKKCIHPTVTPTNTRTPTVLPTALPTAPMQIRTATALPTATCTSTLVPGIASSQVMAYPNPAHGQVKFGYTVSGEVTVCIDVYNISGERLGTIRAAQNGGPGQTLTTTWEAAGIAPGIYLCRITIKSTGGAILLQQTKKVALVR